MSNVIVRKIKDIDIPALMKLGMEMHEEGAFRISKFSAEKVNEVLSFCLVSDRFLCLVAEDNEEIIGLYIAVLTQDWFSEDLVAKDMALYITPSYRTKGLAQLLVKEYLTWAEENKAISIGAGTNSGVNSEGVKRLYEGFGFNTVGYIFRKRI